MKTELKNDERIINAALAHIGGCEGEAEPADAFEAWNISDLPVVKESNEAEIRQALHDAIEALQTSELHDYETGEYIRDATPQEAAESIIQAHHDGGSGVITVSGRTVYAV